MKKTYPEHHKLIKKQFKLVVTFLTAYNGIFIATNKKNEFYFKDPLLMMFLMLIPFPRECNKLKVYMMK